MVKTPTKPRQSNTQYFADVGPENKKTDAGSFKEIKVEKVVPENKIVDYRTSKVLSSACCGPNMAILMKTFVIFYFVRESFVMKFP